jgi:hypothetical protein
MYFSHGMNIVAYFPKARVKEPEEQPLICNGCVTRNNLVTVGSGICYSVRAKATSWENRRVVGSGVFYAVRAKAT